MNDNFFKTKKRKDCNCICHKHPEVMHIMACCDYGEEIFYIERSAFLSIPEIIEKNLFEHIAIEKAKQLWLQDGDKDYVSYNVKEEKNV